MDQCQNDDAEVAGGAEQKRMMLHLPKQTDLRKSVLTEMQTDANAALVTFDARHRIEAQSHQELVAIHADSGIVPKPKLIETRARNLWAAAEKEGET